MSTIAERPHDVAGRDAGIEDFEVLVIGSGAAGVATAYKLSRAGIDSFALLEKAHDVGGTWRDNVYPGLTCDVPSHVYQFSFEPNPNWSRTFSPQAEIYAYVRNTVDKHGIRPKIRFGTEVAQARYDEGDGRWTVLATDGRRFRARFLFNGAGALERPRIPPIAGIETFGGATFHSARWDATYDFAGKRVAVIGNAASGVQLIPKIAAVAERVTVFQRTPNWVIPKPDLPYAAWERALMRRVPGLARLRSRVLFARTEATFAIFKKNSRLGRLLERIAIAAMRRSIKDPAVVRALTPAYPIGCKRILFSNDYYPALARPNVELVTAGVARATPAGIASNDGRLHEADVVVYATGFEVFQSGIAIYGKGGVPIAERWAEAPAAYKGVTVAGFPNLFYLLGPNTALGHNSVWLMIEAQADYAIEAIRIVRDRGDAAIEVRPEALADYNRTIQQRLGGMVWAAGCGAWYTTKTGHNYTLWSGDVRAYRRELAHVDLRHYDLIPARAATACSSGGAPAP